MKFVAAWMGAVAVLALVSCSNPAAPPGNYGTITGTITSSAGQPVAGVVVTVDSGPQSQPSGSDGKYTIQYVPVTDVLSPDVVEVTSVPSGYGKPAPLTNVQVKAGQITPNVDFTLPPA